MVSFDLMKFRFQCKTAMCYAGILALNYYNIINCSNDTVFISIITSINVTVIMSSFVSKNCAIDVISHNMMDSEFVQ